MANYLNISKALPFKFYENTATPGIHFDQDWFCKRIRFFELHRSYKQKWIKSVTTKLQIITTIAPDDLKLYNTDMQLVASFTWNIAGVGANGENAWECLFDVSAVANGTYYLYQKNELLSVKFEAISEPILIADTHRNVQVWKYWHSDNDFGVIWTTGIKMNFQCESGLLEDEFKRDRNAFVDQVHNVRTTSAYPYRTAKLNIGEAPGVAPFIVDIANRITCCDNWYFAGLRFETVVGAAFEVKRQVGYPLIGAAIEVLEANNLDSLQLNDENPIAPGIITAYNIDQGFFGTTNIVHITEFEQT